MDDSLKELVEQRLSGFGFVVDKLDCGEILYCIEKVENRIKNSCNTDVVPTGLLEVATDMVCGEFLNWKNAVGQLGESFSVDAAVKTVQAGDTSVSFDTSMSQSGKFCEFIKYLRSSGEGDLACYRRLKW